MSKENRREKESMRKEKLAGFLYDMAKIIFAGTVLIFAEPFAKQEYEDSEIVITILGVGLMITILLAYIAGRILK